MKRIIRILGKEYDIDKTEFLDLSYRRLAEIPKEVNELVNLKDLRIHDNKIKKIENIDRLVNLERLYLYNNEIEKIDGLNNNRKLKVLILDNNKIEKVENIHHLDRLELLYIFNEFVSENIEESKKVSLINSRAKKLERI